MAETLTLVIDDDGPYTVSVEGVDLFSDEGLSSPVVFPQSVSADVTWYAAAPDRVGGRRPIAVRVVSDDDRNIPVHSARSLPATVYLPEGQLAYVGPAPTGGSSAVTPILVTLARTVNDNNPAVTAPLPDGQMIVAVPGIPSVLAAGGFFGVIVQNTSDVDIKVVGGDVSSLYVGNTDASEYVSVVVGTDLLVAAGATVSVVFDDGAVMQTGSDLSQNGALTNVVSAAGGTFSALANLVIEPA